MTEREDEWPNLEWDSENPDIDDDEEVEEEEPDEDELIASRYPEYRDIFLMGDKDE